MTQQENKILKCTEKYYGDELDLDDYFSDIVESDFEIADLIGRLQDCYMTKLVFERMPEIHEIEFIKDWIDWVVEHLEK